MSGILDDFTPRELVQLRASGSPASSIALYALYLSQLLDRPVSVSQAQRAASYIAKTQWAESEPYVGTGLDMVAFDYEES